MHMRINFSPWRSQIRAAASRKRRSARLQKYYRGKNAAGKEGSGLGLYISGVLMQKMQGELLCTAASDDPECESPGLTVTLLIPLS